MKRKQLYQSIATKMEKDEKTQTKTFPIGFLGYYYYGRNFNKPAFISLGQEGNLKASTSHLIELEDNGRQIQSARWIGQLKVETEDDYLFSTVDDEHLVVKIGDRIVIQEGEVTQICLQEGIYEVEIEYQTAEANDCIFDLQLCWKGTQVNEEVISSELMRRPEFDRDKREVELIPEEGLLKRRAQTGLDEWLDTDGDGIYDLWEINGYTVENAVVVEWKESYEKLGFTKFTSNPNRAHTAHDPYSDLEKASGQVDEGMSWEARHPLIAAVPAISIGMEQIILSRIISETGQVGQSASRATSSSSTTSNTEGVDAQAGFSFTRGPSASATAHFSHTSSQTVEERVAIDKTWSESININKGESANLNANIRCFNTGTGVIYNLKPTVNFVLDGKTLATVTAQLNQQASHLAPDASYPARRLSPMALNTLDEFSSRLIPLNFDQVQTLDAGVRLRLETTQFSGEFIRRDANGGNIRSGSWDSFIPQIERTSAAITLNIGEGEAIERRLAARNPRDPNDRTPELTLGAAIKLAFRTREGMGGRLYYTHERTGNEVAIDENVVHLVMDKNTEKEVKSQMETKKLANVYDVIIRPQMGIQILTAMSIADNDDHRPKIEGVEDTDRGVNGKGYKMNSSKGAYQYFNKKTLKPKTAYVFSWFAKTDSGTATILWTLGLKGREVQLSAQYQRYSIIFVTGSKLDSYDRLQFEILEKVGGVAVFFDDVSIIELKPSQSKEDGAYDNKEVTFGTALDDTSVIARYTSSNSRTRLRLENRYPRQGWQNFLLKKVYGRGANVYQIWDTDQKWVLTWKTDEAGNEVEMLPNKDILNQYWALEEQEGGQFIVSSVSDNVKVLEVSDDRKAIQVSTRRKGPSQLFFIQGSLDHVLPGGIVLLGTALRDGSVVTTQNDDLKLWIKNDGMSIRQRFVLKRVGGVVYQIWDLKQERVVTWRQNDANDREVILIPNKDQFSQSWVLELLNNGRFVISNYSSREMILNVHHASTEDGTAINVQNRNGSLGQQFSIIRESSIGTYVGKYHEAIVQFASAVDQSSVMYTRSQLGDNGIFLRPSEAREVHKEIFVLKSASYLGENVYQIWNHAKQEILAWNRVSPHSREVFMTENTNRSEQFWSLEPQRDGSYVMSNFADSNLVLNVGDTILVLNANTIPSINGAPINLNVRTIANFPNSEEITLDCLAQRFHIVVES